LHAKPDGSYLGQKITPIERVALYIPGGTASYPSTVLMNAIPAKIAGCAQIVMVSPPSKNGRIASPILAAAKLAGVDRVFQVGGAQAIAALATERRRFRRWIKSSAPATRMSPRLNARCSGA
jgi:histidinol dehydrogenase